MSETLDHATADSPHTRNSRRAVAVPLEGVYLEDAIALAPDRGEVVVRSSVVGICGSDTHALAGSHPFLTSAYVPGHEAVGIVSEVGEDVEGIAPGQRVILKPNVSCGKCVNCLADRSNACEKLTWIGCDTSQHWFGAMASEFIAPARNLFPVPEGVDDRTAVLVECLATPVHAARIAGDLTGAHVVVLGAGTIGVLCVIAALHAGAKSVVVTDMDTGKLERARRIGAHGAVLASAPDANEQILDALDNPTVDVVLDCVANERSFAQSVALLRRAGTLVVVGVPARDAVLPMPLIQDWEIRVQGCAAYTEADVLTAIRIAADGGVPTDEIISQVFGLEHVVEAFAAATNDSSGKVLIVP